MRTFLNTLPHLPIKELVEKKGFKWFEGPYKLNIVSIRSTRREAGEYDDKMVVAFQDQYKHWIVKMYSVTTDPGLMYLTHKMLKKTGTAILAQGQYDSYRLDWHQGKQYTLCQRLGPVTVWRDRDRDGRIDLGGTRETGMFGINIHFYDESEDNRVSYESAGCTDFRYKAEHKEFVELCKVSSKYHGNRFTYTLIDDKLL